MDRRRKKVGCAAAHTLGESRKNLFFFCPSWKKAFLLFRASANADDDEAKGREEGEMKDSSVFPAHVRGRGEKKCFSPNRIPPSSDRSSFERQQSQRGGIRQLQRNCCLCCISLFSLLPSSPSPLSCLDRAPLLATFGQFHGLTVAPSSSSSSETAAGRRLGKTEEGEDGGGKRKRRRKRGKKKKNENKKGTFH